jgi:ABC-type transport system substrate-binding protein
MSHSEVEISGDLPKIIGNEENLYEGNLIYYFRVLFFRANNLYNPYHNFRHMSHVLWLCYKACQYYSHELPPRQMRTLLIAALFHDFDHTGRPHRGDVDPDGINIEIAISGLRPELDKMVERQSMESDKEKRRQIVWEIEKKLAEDVARPMLYHSVSGTCWHPYVRGYTMTVNAIYNGLRMEDVWLDK